MPPYVPDESSSTARFTSPSVAFHRFCIAADQAPQNYLINVAIVIENVYRVTKASSGRKRAHTVASDIG
jgi:hypothetical protein